MCSSIFSVLKKLTSSWMITWEVTVTSSRPLTESEELFVLGYVLGGISAVGAVPGDSPKETLRKEQPQGPSRPTQDKQAILEALYDDMGMKASSIEVAQAIRVSLEE